MVLNRLLSHSRTKSVWFLEIPCLSRYTRRANPLWVTDLYTLARVAEAFDPDILNKAKLLSGEILKHLTAAVAVSWLLKMLPGTASVRASPMIGGNTGVHQALDFKHGWWGRFAETAVFGLARTPRRVVPTKERRA
jgi:hypothetical protein